MAELTSIVAIPKTRKQEKMFSDLELAIVALVFVFTLGCIMQVLKKERGRLLNHQNNSTQCPPGYRNFRLDLKKRGNPLKV